MRSKKGGCQALLMVFFYGAGSKPHPNAFLRINAHDFIVLCIHGMQFHLDSFFLKYLFWKNIKINIVAVMKILIAFALSYEG